MGAGTSAAADGGVWRITVTAPDAELAERTAAALESSSGAVSAFETGPGGAWVIEGFATCPPERAELETRLSLAWADRGEAPAARIEKVPPRDWVRENQESFPPRRVGRFYIHGTHNRGRAPPGTIALLIDAATAFGTGEHATTTGCLRTLNGLARRRRRYRRILDMGTGTGILAMAAARLWRRGTRRPVLAVDIDGNSVRVARENARRNGVGGDVRARWSRGYRGRAVRAGRPYDLVLANILARPLMAMAHDLRAALAPGGVAVLSGLLARQAPQVLAAHRLRRLFLCQGFVIEGWQTLVLRRRSTSDFPISEIET